MSEDVTVIVCIGKLVYARQTIYAQTLENAEELPNVLVEWTANICYERALAILEGRSEPNDEAS